MHFKWTRPLLKTVVATHKKERTSAVQGCTMPYNGLVVTRHKPPGGDINRGKSLTRRTGDRQLTTTKIREKKLNLPSPTCAPPKRGRNYLSGHRTERGRSVSSLIDLYTPLHHGKPILPIHTTQTLTPQRTATSIKTTNIGCMQFSVAIR